MNREEALFVSGTIPLCVLNIEKNREKPKSKLE
jgi:hypothetical protein